MGIELNSLDYSLYLNKGLILIFNKTLGESLFHLNDPTKAIEMYDMAI